MNIIEKIKQIINDYPKISEFSNNIHVDYTESTPTNYGISSSGDSLIRKDILGNQYRQHNFVLYAVNQAFEDYDRLANSTFLLELGYYLERITGNEITVNIGEIEQTGHIDIITCSNAMLYQIPDNVLTNGVTYQVQINVQYNIKESEDF